MKTIAIVFLFIAGLLSGCSSTSFKNMKLPVVDASKATITHNNPLFNVQIEVTELKQLPDKVTAKRLSYTRSGRFSSTTIVVDDYVRERDSTKTGAPVEVVDDQPATE